MSKKIIFIICIIICILSVLYIGYYFYSIYKTKSNLGYEKYVITENDENEEKIKKISKLKQNNNDLVGWIRINDTNINFPVMKNGEYYLSHNLKKEEDLNGLPFVDEECNMETNTLIHGHNKNNGTIFNELIKYEDEKFYKNHNKIEFITLDKVEEYKIISVFKSKIYKQKETNIFKYYFYENLDTEEKFDTYIKNVTEMSLYKIEENAKYGEKILTLSTCEYSQENGRIVIVAKLLQ